MNDELVQGRDLVVIGASAGGLEVLRRVVSELPGDLNASVCVVLHIAPGSPSALAPILDRAGPLPCRPAADGDPLRPGQILVAPPDRHLIVECGSVELTLGPQENGHRPAVNPAVSIRRARPGPPRDRRCAVRHAGRRRRRAGGDQGARRRDDRPGPGGGHVCRNAGERDRTSRGRRDRAPLPDRRHDRIDGERRRSARRHESR